MSFKVKFWGVRGCIACPSPTHLDTEHMPGRPDQNILGLIESADLVICDSTYTDTEFMRKIGWGHSTWRGSLRINLA